MCKEDMFLSVANKGTIHSKAYGEMAKTQESNSGGQLLSTSDILFDERKLLEPDVAALEGAFAILTIGHHHRCKSMNCTSCLLKNISPDSKAAQHFPVLDL